MKPTVTIHLMALRVQNAYGWSYEFSNAYAVERWYEGNSHRTAYRMAMESPYVRLVRKPSSLIAPTDKGVKL